MSAESPDLSSYTVAQLKAELSKRGLSTSGRKQDLVRKLLAHANGSAVLNGESFGDFCVKRSPEADGTPLTAPKTPKSTVAESPVKEGQPHPEVAIAKTENAEPQHGDVEEKPKEDSVKLEPEAALSISESEKRIARLKSDKLRARAKRFKMHGDQHIKASGAVDIDDFDSVRERYLSMKRRQERWGTTNEEAKRAFHAIEEKYKRLERKRKFD